MQALRGAHSYHRILPRQPTSSHPPRVMQKNPLAQLLWQRRCLLMPLLLVLARVQMMDAQAVSRFLAVMSVPFAHI